MDKINRWMLTARIAQIILGASIFASSLIINQDGFGNNALLYVSVGMGAATMILGTVGLFSISKRPNAYNKRLFLLILYADAWAFAMSLGSAICDTMVFSSSYYYYYYNHGPAVVPTVLSYICMLIIIPVIFRTCRLWSRGMLSNEATSTAWATPKPSDEEKPAVYEVHNHYYNQSAPNDSRAPRAQQSYRMDSIKSDRTARPVSVAETTAHWSTFSGATTIGQQNIDAHTGPPTRAPSHAAPAYSRVEVGSKTG